MEPHPQARPPPPQLTTYGDRAERTNCSPENVGPGGSLRDGLQPEGPAFGGTGEQRSEVRAMRSETRSYDTSRTRFTDITRDLASFVAAQGADGLVSVFVPHATAGLALMETGSGSERDLEGALERLLPRDARYAHSHGSPGHGADHLLPAFLSPSLTIPVVDGEMALGTWQSVVLVDLNRDNPRREVRFSMLAG